MLCKEYSHDGVVLAKVWHTPPTLSSNMVSFCTDPSDPLQVAMMKHSQGNGAVPHYHLPADRTVHGCPEVLIVTSGGYSLKLYDNNTLNTVYEVIVSRGSIVLLLAGGHSITAVTPTAELIEVKQGPYMGTNDKVRFKPKETTDAAF